jgi:hypothetical protein
MSGYIPIDFTADSYFYMNSSLAKNNVGVCNGSTSTFYEKNNCILNSNNLDESECISVTTDSYYNAELCKNYDLAQKLQYININHDESGVNFFDYKLQYSNSVTETINLAIGILGAFIFCYYN